MPKLDVYNLGQLGINRVKSPVQVKDGELLTAQNATVRPVQGQLALTKRDGMAKINSTVAAGTLVSISNIPRGTLGGREVCIVTPDVPAGDWRTGCWSSELGLFIALETGSNVISSPDGETWTSVTVPSTPNWNRVTYSPDVNLFVAVGGSAGTAAEQIMTSPDGVTWTNRTAPSDRTWQCVAWSPTLTLFAAVASSGAAAGMVMTSPDGVTWTARNASDARGWRQIVWAESLGLFVAVAETVGISTNIMTSPNGTAWTTVDTGITGGWNDMAWSNELGIFVATGEPGVGGPYSMYSPDGVNWTAGSLPEATASLSSIAWSPELEMFLAVTAGSGNMYNSIDGINWNLIASNCSQTAIPGVIWSPELEQFLTVGADTDGNPVFELVSVS